MNRRTFSSGLAAALAIPAGVHAEGVDQAGLEDAVRRLGEAWARGDVAAAEAMLSPGCTHTSVTGAFQDRAAWLAYTGARAGRGTRIGFADVRTRFLGGIAVVTGRNDVAGLGDPLLPGRNEASVRFTQVWIRDNGRWLRDAFQATLVAAA
jgi:hypothetical protein